MIIVIRLHFENTIAIKRKDKVGNENLTTYLRAQEVLENSKEVEAFLDRATANLEANPGMIAPAEAVSKVRSRSSLISLGKIRHWRLTCIRRTTVVLERN